MEHLPGYDAWKLESPEDADESEDEWTAEDEAIERAERERDDPPDPRDDW